MDVIRDYLKTWLIPLSFSKKIGIMELVNLYVDLSDNTCIPEIKTFSAVISDVAEITGQNKEKIISSGGGCFVASILLSMSIRGEIVNIDRICSLVYCYLYLDYIMDVPNLDKAFKLKFIDGVKSIISNDNSYGESRTEHNHPKLNRILDECRIHYIKMITGKDEKETKRCSTVAKKLFLSQINSMNIQSSETRNNDEYFSICFEKGKYTSQLVGAVLNIENGLDYYIGLLGSCCQLVDDVFDVYDDITDGINTIATHTLSKDGNIDSIIVKIFDMLSSLPSDFNLIRYAFVFILTYSVSKNSDVISQRMRLILDPYTYLDYKTGLDLESIMISIFSKIN